MLDWEIFLLSLTTSTRLMVKVTTMFYMHVVLQTKRLTQV